MKTIFEYKDIIQYLNDRLAFLKEEGRPRLSLRDLAKESGVSAATLSLLLNKKQKLSEKTFHKIAPFLQLSSRELEYLSQIKNLSTASSVSQKENALSLAMKELQRRGHNSPELESYRYLSSWLNVCLREAVQIEGFSEKSEDLCKKLQFPRSESEVKKAMKFLKDHQYLVVEDGTINQTKKNLSCNRDVFSLSLSSFHKTMLSLASQSIDKVPPERRQLEGLTVAVSKDQSEEIKKIIDEALDKIVRIASDKTNATEVYHVECAFFPLTKFGERDEN